MTILQRPVFVFTAVAFGIFALAVFAYSQQSKSQHASAAPSSIKPIKMSMHGYTGYPDDQEHCFVRDSGTSKRPLFFDVYTDVAVQESQIGMELYTFEGGSPAPVGMVKGTKSTGDWYVKSIAGNMFVIEVKKDARPHLGPGPYMTLISISSTAAAPGSAGRFVGYYPYGTWEQSPLDCWYH